MFTLLSKFITLEYIILLLHYFIGNNILIFYFCLDFKKNDSCKVFPFPTRKQLMIHFIKNFTSTRVLFNRCENAASYVK